MFKTPSMPQPEQPPPPPNPPMFGENAAKKKPQGTGSQQFNSTVLGSLPTQSGNKTLLGQ